MRDRLVVCCESQRKSGPYIDALVQLGVDANKIQLATADQPQPDLAAAGAAAAGVVLCGGPDLDPRWYGDEPRGDANLSILPELDLMDWTLLQGAKEGRTPVWAICRGMQTFNVFRGGTLWQDLPSQVAGTLEHRPDVPHDSIAHAICVRRPQERFGEILGSQPSEVNSRHHQAVRQLGSDLIPVAESPDGIVEVLALDRPDWWVKGVQWHPENLMHLPVQRRLWSEFLDAADRKAELSDQEPIRN